jgi:hypothetical protein
MVEQAYLLKAREFRRRQGGSGPPTSAIRPGQPAAADIRQPTSSAKGRQATEEASAGQLEQTDAVRAMLQEMRPYLSRSLQHISDEGLLLLVRWNLHVAAERAIDARRAGGNDNRPTTGSE